MYNDEICIHELGEEEDGEKGGGVAIKWTNIPAPLC